MKFYLLGDMGSGEGSQMVVADALSKNIGNKKNVFICGLGDNIYENGREKYSITEMRCYRPTSDNYYPSNPASLSVLNSSFILEIKIGLFDSAGDELESYLVDRYVFNPYIYSSTS